MNSTGLGVYEGTAKMVKYNGVAWLDALTLSRNKIDLNVLFLCLQWDLASERNIHQSR